VEDANWIEVAQDCVQNLDALLNLRVILPQTWLFASVRSE
jgi:hypothetical protein